MKILQVVGDSKFGGATYLLIEWCRFLVDNGSDVHVLSTDTKTIAELRKIPHISIVDWINIPRDVAPVKDGRALAQMWRLMQRECYDVVHTHTSTPGVLGRTAAWIANVPVRFHSAHGWPVTEFSGLKAKLLFTPLENLAARLATRVICVSHAAIAQGARFHLAPTDKMVAVCNGIDPEPFLTPSPSASGRLRDELGRPADALIVGSCGRLAAQKDYPTLIRAMPFLKRLVDRPLFLALAGEGPDKHALQRLSQSLGLEDCVRFLGFREEVPEFLHGIDLFVSPSLWEGLSISIMEAMAAGKPIVTTNIPPNAELIVDEITGLLVPTRSPEALA
jgi:glycosyltransferase involved in cell wall biosynthesis